MASKKKTSSRAKVDAKTKSKQPPKASTKSAARDGGKKSIAPKRKAPAARRMSTSFSDEQRYYVVDLDQLHTLYEMLYTDLSTIDRKDLSKRRGPELGCFVACHVAHYLVGGGCITQEMHDKWFMSPVLALTTELLDQAEKTDGGIDEVGLPV